MTEVLIIDQHAVDGTHTVLVAACVSVKETKTQLAKHAGASFAKGAEHFIEDFMSDVVTDVVNKIPSELSKVIASYADGLTKLADVIAAADQHLSVQAHQSVDGALQGVPVPAQGSSPTTQGGPANLQGGPTR